MTDAPGQVAPFERGPGRQRVEIGDQKIDSSRTERGEVGRPNSARSAAELARPVAIGRESGERVCSSCVVAL